MFIFFKRSIIIFIIGVVIVIWWLLPFLISLKRWFFGVGVINIVYPFNIQVLLIYYIVYIILLLILSYKVLRMYYFFSNDSSYINQILIKISILLDKPWVFLEKNLWSKSDLRMPWLNKYIQMLLKMHVGSGNQGFGIPFTVFFYNLYKYIIYINLLLLVSCLYIEVLYYNQVYYTYYFLMLILLEKLLGFIQNRIVIILKNNLIYYFKLLKLDISKRKIYTNETIPHRIILDILPYMDEDKNVMFVLYYYRDENDNSKIICDSYRLNLNENELDLSGKELLMILFEVYKMKFNMKFNSINEILQNKQLCFDFVKHCSFYLRYYIGDCNSNIKVLGVRFKLRLQKHMLVKSIIRVMFVIILITIVLYINSCF